MMKYTARWTAALLAVVLLVSLLPAPAFAAGESVPVASFDIDSWTEIPDDWQAPFTRTSLPALHEEAYLHLNAQSYNVSSVTHASALDGLETYTVGFDAKVNAFTAGPGPTNQDYSTLAVQLMYADGRLMFCIEEDGVHVSSADATWGAILAYPAGFDPYGWHSWAIAVDRSTNEVDISVDGALSLIHI